MTVPRLHCHLLLHPSLAHSWTDTSVNDFTLLISPLLLAQSTRLEIGGILGGDASVLEDSSLVCLEDRVLVEPYLKEA